MSKPTAPQITVTKNGPYLVSGDIPLAPQHIVTNADGESLEWREGARLPHAAQFALCRCGGSSNKPFCDGTHKKNGFDGTETASREPFDAEGRRNPRRPHDGAEGQRVALRVRALLRSARAVSGT